MQEVHRASECSPGVHLGLGTVQGIGKREEGGGGGGGEETYLPTSSYGLSDVVFLVVTTELGIRI